MTRVSRSSSIVLAVLCWLLGVATSASAECAWVLWKSTEHSGPGSPTEPKVKKDWEIIRAASLQQECEKVLVAVWKVGVKQGKERQGPAYKFTSNDKAIGLYFAELGSSPGIDSWYQEVRFFCLPDTVDPRGPKGK